MQTEKGPGRPPILEPWRVAALILIVAASQLFVHAIEPAGAGAVDSAAVSSHAR